MKPVIKVDIVSDVVCPWCYIGKRRIERAMQTLADEFEFDITYLPFELNPNAPKEGFNQKEYLTNKFGSEEKYKQITEHVSRIAAEEGLHFDFIKQQKSPNTKDAHRLLWYARKEGKQIQLKELLMQAYFEKGIDLTKNENLISIAVEAGLNGNKISTFLSSQEGIEEVENSVQLNYQRGISGVPFYIINNTYGVSGAQSSEVFIQALRQIGETTMTTSADACDVENPNC
jgi:predicted DsbA family dithiol-disulfide isomerase